MWKIFLALGLLVAFLFVLFSLLPSVDHPPYASPDETSYAVIAKWIATTGVASAPESYAPAYPWIHPRSFASVGLSIVPVGFLGWPWFLSVFYSLFGQNALPWIGTLLVLSSVWPLFRLLRRFGAGGAWFGLLVGFTFPALILFTNRGLFPNAPMIAFSLWAIYLLRQWSDRRPAFLAILWSFAIGFVIALAIAIRPIELPWLLPWLVWAGWSARPRRVDVIAALLGMVLVFLPTAWLAHATYGNWFSIGYWVQQNVDPSLAAPSVSVAPLIVDRSILPFGLHPNNIRWNVQAFLLNFLWPWTLLLTAGALTFLARRRFRLKGTEALVPFLIALWTIGYLLTIYGSGLYADHVRVGAVTIGNSFLRYLLPLAPLTAWAFAYLWSVLPKRLVVRIVGALLACSLAAFGVYRAYAGDDESLRTTRVELVRYAQIREATKGWFHPGDVIVSERSDKIFFPEYRGVSPIPTVEQIATFAKDENAQVGLFVRPLSQEQKDAWAGAGLEVQELATFGRERLYRLFPRTP